MITEITYRATIHVGLKIRDTGEIHPTEKAFNICQAFVTENPDCVSFTETNYIYKNNFEPGVIIEFIQYPRFPRSEDEIKGRALQLAGILMVELQQFVVTVICPDKTYMLENETLTPVVTQLNKSK